jgi:RNA polymerase sigma-70 factor, ECF subfamily
MGFAQVLIWSAVKLRSTPGGNFWEKLWSHVLGSDGMFSRALPSRDAHDSAISQAPIAHPSADSSDIAEFQAGREVGFNRLVLRHKDKVHSLCFRLLGRNEDALDVAQEVFVRVYQGLPKFRGEAKFSTWLHTITVNACRNRQASAAWRENQKSHSLEDSEEWLGAEPQDGDLEMEKSQAPAWSSGSPERDLLRKRRETLLQRALSALPIDFREAMVLRDVNGRSYEEIAAVTGWELGTVRSRIFRAREKLRELLQKGWE